MSVLPQVVKNHFRRIFLPSHSLDTISSADMLFCFEVLSKELTKEKVVLLRVHQVSTFATDIFTWIFWHLIFICLLVGFWYLFSSTSAEASGSQYSYSQVCCLPETSSVRRWETETLYALLPCGLLQPVSHSFSLWLWSWCYSMLSPF